MNVVLRSTMKTKVVEQRITQVLKELCQGGFCCFQLHSLLKSLPGTFTHSQNAQMD